MSLTSEIKEFALDLGYSKVGITTAESFTEYMVEIKARGAMYDFFLEDPRRPLWGAEPERLMPSAKSIISLVGLCAKIISRSVDRQDRPNLPGPLL